MQRSGPLCFGQDKSHTEHPLVQARLFHGISYQGIWHRTYLVRHPPFSQRGPNLRVYFYIHTSAYSPIIEIEIQERA